MAFKGPVQPCGTAGVVDIASAIRGRGRAENVHGLIAKGTKVPEQSNTSLRMTIVKVLRY